MLAAIYARESSDDTKKAPSVAEQVSRIRMFIAEINQTPTHVFWAAFPELNEKNIYVPADFAFSDEISGQTEQRPGYQGLLETIKAHKIRAVIVWYHDRIMRKTEYYHRFIRICKERNVKIYSLEGKWIKDENIDDLIRNTIEGLSAEMFARETGQKTKMAYEAIKKAACANHARPKWGGAWPVEYINRAKDLSVKGLTTRSIAERLKLEFGDAPGKSWVAWAIKQEEW
jgi:DNA invertase Pin-like site-specific DNA recombinase